jgi:hypothetical protein
MEADERTEHEVLLTPRDAELAALSGGQPQVRPM